MLCDVADTVYMQIDRQRDAQIKYFNNMKYTHEIHTCIQAFPPLPTHYFTCSPAGIVERSLSIILPDNRITVSFSHQISHHIQTTTTAVYEKQTLAVHHTVFTNTDMHVNRASYPGSSGEERTLYLLIVYERKSGSYSMCIQMVSMTTSNGANHACTK